LAWTTLLIVSALTAGCARAEERRMTPAQQAEVSKMLDELARSHIDGNVPAAADFDRILRRDLTTHFAAKGMADPKVEFEMLRQGPTQSGVSYPKYYLWVRVSGTGATSLSGAVRVAAMDKTEFGVTDFLSAEQIRSSPPAVGQTFPAALVSAIVAKAAKD
jgi:hypothetical protein